MNKILVYLLTPLAWAASGWAQTPLTLQGVVADPSGAVIPGASVTLSSGANVAKSAESDANGKYVIPAVRPGKYTLKVTST
jgi:protocatechuate 3,4-dioxygenase beta subunit